MKMSTRKKTNKKIETAVVGSYHNIENAVVSGYKKMEDAVVSGYQKVEDKFIDTFFVEDGESIEEARRRITGKFQENGEKET